MENDVSGGPSVREELIDGATETREFIPRGIIKTRILQQRKQDLLEYEHYFINVVTVGQQKVKIIVITMLLLYDVKIIVLIMLLIYARILTDSQ